MAVREIAIHTDNLKRDTESLRTALRDLKTNKETMLQEIEELSKMWKGQANQVFVSQFRSDCVSFDNLCNTLEEMIRAMENAKNEYEKCDNRVKDLINAIRI